MFNIKCTKTVYSFVLQQLVQFWRYLCIKQNTKRRAVSLQQLILFLSPPQLTGEPG